MKKGRPNFLGRTSSAERLTYLVSILYSIFENLQFPNFLSFISFQSILHESEAISSFFFKFPEIKEGHPNIFGG